MKKLNGIIMSILMMALITTMSKAQEINVGLGVKAGATYSQYVSGFESQYAYQNSFGYTGGLFIPVSVTEKIIVQPEVLVSYRQFATSYYQDAKRYTLNADYYYLDIPLVGQYKVIDKVKVEGGISVSYLMHANDLIIEDERGYRLREVPSLLTIDYVKPAFEQPKGWSFGLVAGAYYELPFGLEAGARINYQLTDAYDYNRLSEKVRPVTYNILVSYKIPYVDFNF